MSGGVAVSLVGLAARAGGSSYTAEVAAGERVTLRTADPAEASALLRACLGEPAAEGAIAIDGVEPAGLGHAGLRALRGRCGLWRAEAGLLDNRTGRDSVRLPTHWHQRGRERPEPEDERRLLEELGVAGAADRLPAEMTAAERRGLLLARALLPGPALLLLTRPWAGAGDAEARRLDAALDAAAARAGTTVIAAGPHEGSTAGRVVEPDHAATMAPEAAP